MNGKSFDKYDFKPKLSKHELILERYKTILNTSVNKTENLIYKDAEPSVNSECRSTNEELLKDILFNKESIKSILNPNDFINKEKDNFSNRDDLDHIRNKYLKNANNNYKLSNANLVKNNTSMINNLINQTNTDLEVEKIKLKYMNNFNKHENTTNKVIEEKLSKYRKEYLDSESDSNNNFIKYEKEIKSTNNAHEKIKVEENTSNELLQRLSSIENKLNQLNLISFTKPLEVNDKVSNKNEIPKEKSLREEEVITKPLNDNICQSKEMKDSIKETSTEINITNAKEKISNLKVEKIQNKENLKIKSSICTKDILNKMIEDVTGSLFHDKCEIDENINQLYENKENLIINKEKISKISKSRTNIPSKIKIPSFEEFLQNEIN